MATSLHSDAGGKGEDSGNLPLDESSENIQSGVASVKVLGVSTTPSGGSESLELEESKRKKTASYDVLHCSSDGERYRNGESTDEEDTVHRHKDSSSEENPLLEESSETSTSVVKQKNTSSIGGASFNFINSIIGSGIIGIPSALQQTGFLLGVVLLAVVAAITDYTVILLIKNGNMARKYTYQGMVTAAFGLKGYWYLTMVQFLFPFFAMAGYIVIMGDTLSRILDQIFVLAHVEHPPEILTEPRDIIIKVVMVILVMLPLSMLRNISKLEKFSAFAVLCIVFIVTVTVYEIVNLFCAVRCFQPDVSKSVFTTWFINVNFVQGIGIMGFAFVCHHNTYLIYGSLHNRSLKRFSIVTHISVSTSCLFCMVLGFAGFLAFMDVTQGDLLNNYCGFDPVANAARFFFALVIMLTYPIECFVAREVMEIALARFPRVFIEKIKFNWLRKLLENFLFSPRHQSFLRHVILTLFLVITTLVLGASTNDLKIVLAFNGCFTAVPLAFIIPTACFLKLSDKKWYSPAKLLAMVVMLFGVLVMAIGTVLAVIEVVQSYLHEPVNFDNPNYCIGKNETAENLCCAIFNATANFTGASTCGCVQRCPDPDLLPILSEDFCNASMSNKTNEIWGF